MGDAYTVADPYLFTIARWMEVDSVDPAAFPRVLDHRDRMAERPAVQRALKAEGLAYAKGPSLAIENWDSIVTCGAPVG
jgi:glutathione S-transferase